jgi:hypothetical protein
MSSGRKDLAVRDDTSGLLIDRLAASIVDESLPLKDVEKELRGCVAEVAVKKRGLGKREVASRCGVTEKSIDNYLKEARANPKSPEREISRLIQDGPLSLEEIYEGVRPILCHGRHFTLDDAKRALEKLIRTGEVVEVPGKRYGGSERPSITNPLTVEAYRDLVDEKARDMDYIILTQKELSPSDLPPKGSQHFSRSVGDTNLVRIDFTVDVDEEALPEFYEKLSAEVARLTLKYEKKKGASRVRIILGMRAVVLLLAALIGLLFAGRLGAGDPAMRDYDSWELDNRSAQAAGPGGGANDPAADGDAAVDSQGASQGRNDYPVVFIRGDANSDHQRNVSDIIAMIGYLFQGRSLPCEDAADFNDDGRITIEDPLRLIQFLFASSAGFGGPALEPHADGTSDHLGCQTSGF